MFVHIFICEYLDMSVEDCIQTDDKGHWWKDEWN